MIVEVDGFEFNFTDAINAFVFDEKDKEKPAYHGLSHAMKAVDLIVEFDSTYLFVEVKDFHSPGEYRESGHFNHLLNSLKYKYRDSWLYRWAENKVDKPIHYLCLLSLESALLLRMQKEMRKQLPLDISLSRWQRGIAESCVILNLEHWNRRFRAWPVSKVTELR